MNTEAYLRGFERRCRERGVDSSLLHKHAEALRSRGMKKQAGIGAISRALGCFGGFVGRHPVAFGLPVLGATTFAGGALGNRMLFGKEKETDYRGAGLAGGVGVAAGGVATLVGLLVADRLMRKRKQKKLAVETDAATQETAQLPGMA